MEQLRPSGRSKRFSTTKKLLIAACFIVLWGASVWVAWQEGVNSVSQEELSFTWGAYPLLNPRLQRLDKDSREERLAKTFVTLIPLRDKIFEYLGDKKENIAFYVEDLNTGAWMGWQERTEFIPASLLKIPVAIGIMKKVDEGAWTLETAFNMDSRYKDKSFGSLWQVPDGTPLSIDRLLKEMLQYSDNTAANILMDQLTVKERDDIYYYIGLENPEAPLEQAANRPLFRKMTPRNLVTIFRALYNATYLTRQSSQYLATILTETKFDKTLPSEIPPDVKVAHKIANFFVRDPNQPKNFHDCGIVYVPEHPYLFCFMTKEMSVDEAMSAIVGIGNITYRHFTTVKTP
ncbi:MAG: serine hydrolase [bacterium]|nr:serine hydrolase [bacterium]